MSVRTRYKFLKKIHPEYLIIFVGKNGYYSYGVDALIFNSFRKKNILKQIKIHQISYILIDNLHIEEFFESDINHYNSYYYLECFKKIFGVFLGKYR